MEFKDAVFEGMTPKEREIFTAVYPRFSKEILPVIKGCMEEKGMGADNSLTEEQKRDVLSEVMPKIMPTIVDMMSKVDGVDMFTFMNAFSKGMSNIQTSKRSSKDELDRMLED